MLKLKCDDDLKKLAVKCSFRRQEKFLRQLHRERGGSTGISPVSAQVMPRPADHRVIIHAAMLEISPILN